MIKQALDKMGAAVKTKLERYDQKQFDLDKRKLVAMEIKVVMSQKQSFEHLMLIKSLPPKTGCIIFFSFFSSY